MKTKLDRKKAIGECQHVLEGKCERCLHPMTFNIKSCLTELQENTDPNHIS